MNQPNPQPEFMVKLLAASFLNNMIDTAPPEIKKALQEARDQARAGAVFSKETAQTTAIPPLGDGEHCACPACTLKNMLFPELTRKEIAFSLRVSGRIPMDVAQQVGGITPGGQTRADSERIMAALLLSSASGIDAASPEAQSLQQQAVSHFTKGIQALNGLRAA